VLLAAPSVVLSAILTGGSEIDLSVPSSLLDPSRPSLVPIPLLQEQNVRKTHRSALTAVGVVLAFALGVACKGEDPNAGAAEAEKKAQQEAAAELQKPVALISAYLPYVRPADEKDRYLPKRRPDEERSTAYAADEVRHVANAARQKLRGDSAVVKDLTAALAAVSQACSDAADPTAVEKCVASVQKLDDTLKKSEAASQGGAVKFPRVAPESVTEEAKKELATFLKAKGPGAAAKAYVGKRSDPNVSSSDLAAACQGALDEADEAARAFEKADEPIRLIAVTRKMSMESQCGLLTATDNLRKEVNDCRKKPKSTECKVACSKAKARIEDGIPAATFLPFEKEFAEICKE
jgi:hypothetical protein